MSEKFATPWKEFSKKWQKYYTLPGRPSKQAISYYRKYAKEALRSIKNPKILIFGMTPELRNMSVEFKGAQVCAIDLNMEMILAMTELCRKKSPGEILVRGNWCEMPFASGYFDVAFGDLTLSNVPYRFQDQYLKEAARVLRPKGYFIQRMEVAVQSHKNESADGLFEKYKNIPLRKSTAMEMFCHFRKLVFDAKAKTVDMKKLKKLWAKWWKRGRFQHPNKQISFLLNQNWTMWQPLDKVWSVDYENGVRKQVSKYFKIEQEKVLSDCRYREVDEIFPIWVCKVKK